MIAKNWMESGFRGGRSFRWFGWFAGVEDCQGDKAVRITLHLCKRWVQFTWWYK